MLPLSLTAGLAHWLSRRRIFLLPFGERWLCDTPALSSSPGHAPTQEARCLSEGKGRCRSTHFGNDLLCRIDA
jgi:hypothetical protein